MLLLLRRVEHEKSAAPGAVDTGDGNARLRPYQNRTLIVPHRGAVDKEGFMATIKKREGKTGTSYLIRSSCGYDVSGRQVMRSMTWRPKPGMTAKQIEKELNRQAVLFDEKCAAQGVGGGNIKFETFARQWFQEYAEPNLRARTVDRLHQQEPRTYQALGHIRLDKLTARQIQRFIDSLGAEGVSTQGDRAEPNIEQFKNLGLTQREVSKMSGVSPSTVSAIFRGKGVMAGIADKVSKGLGRNDLFTAKKSAGRLSPKTIQHYLSFVSDVMEYAFRLEMIPMNPCKRVTAPTKRQAEREVYTLEEAQRFLDSLDNAPIMYKAFFILAIYGGFRRGELLGLEWKDIDFDNHTISIRRTSQYLSGRGVFTDDTKTEKSRRVLKLPLGVFDVLKKLRADQAQRRLLLGDAWENTDRLFVGDTGRPLNPNSPYHWLSHFCKQTGQRFLGIHAFRHLNASLLINSGVDVKTVSTSLGHSQISTTLDIYSHTFEEAQARASEAVADLLNKKQA